MNTVKQDVLEMIRGLPEGVDYDEIMAEIYFRQKVDKSLKQIDQGKTISHQEARERISQWLQ